MPYSRHCLAIVCLLTLSLTILASDADILTVAEQGDIEAVRALVQADQDLTTTVDDRGYTPLHKAAYNNHLDIAEYLISAGADVNATSDGGSMPLHGAASYGHLDMVRLLLDRGAEVDVANAGGYTPLLSASSGSHSEIVESLINAGSDVNAQANNGRTPLFMAVWNAEPELTGFLLSHGAEADIPTGMGMSLPFFATAFRDREFGSMLVPELSDVGETNELGLSLLHYSAARGLADQVQMLLDRGIDVNAQDSLGRSPLFYASLWGHDDMVGILEGHGAGVENADQGWFEGDYLGRTLPGKTTVEFVGNELRTPFTPHGTIAISPDGTEMFWCHQAMPVQAMWYSRQVDGVWQKPVIAPFTDPELDYADGHPSFSVDGSRVYFHTHRPHPNNEDRKEDTDIWYVEKVGGGWGAPLPLGSPVNSDHYELAPTVASSGNLYFVGSGYDDSYGVGDIYISELVNGEYSTPRNLGSEVNSEDHEIAPCISPDESYLLFASTRGNRYRGHLSLYACFKKDNGGWTKAVSLGRTSNRGMAWHSFITADNKYVIYQQGTSYYWFSTALIADLRRVMIGPDQSEIGVRVPTWRKSEQVFEHASTNDIALGDLDADGDLDAVFSNMHDNDSRIYLNDGRGRFAATEQLLTKQGHGVDLGDLDADGDLDIVISCAEYNLDLMVYLNDGQAGFTHLSQNLGDSLLAANNVSLYDVDSDGDLDAAVVYYREDNLIYLNDGLGQFSRSDLTFPDVSNWADVDGDGDIDILQREPGVGFKTLLNDGNGHFVEHWSMADSTLMRGWLGLDDFDGDGDVDAVVPYRDQSEHRYSTVFHNDGTGRFVESNVRLPLTRFSRMSTGDLNGDGHPDVFLNNLGLPSAVWLNDGAGGLFDSGIRLPGKWQNTTCPLGDLDGDGDLDAFVSAFGGGPNELWFND